MLSVLFQNKHFCAVFKPAEILSVPSRTGAQDPRPVIGRLLETQIGQKLWPCHRLDEDVSGILLFALNADSHRAANRWFETHEIRKFYQAVTTSVSGDFSEGETVTWTCKLMRGKKRAYEATFGKDALTEAILLERSLTESTSLWQLSPLTGRSHQLRYEMMRHNYPILGDKLYQSSTPWHEAGIGLRAAVLDLGGCHDASRFELPSQLSLPSELLLGRIKQPR